MIVNIWNHDGGFVLGGIFHSPEVLIAAIKNASESTIRIVNQLWNEQSRFGIPDYSDQFKISICVSERS